MSKAGQKSRDALRHHANRRVDKKKRACAQIEADRLVKKLLDKKTGSRVPNFLEKFESLGRGLDFRGNRGTP